MTPDARQRAREAALAAAGEQLICGALPGVHATLITNAIACAIEAYHDEIMRGETSDNDLDLPRDYDTGYARVDGMTRLDVNIRGEAIAARWSLESIHIANAADRVKLAHGWQRDAAAWAKHDRMLWSDNRRAHIDASLAAAEMEWIYAAVELIDALLEQP